MSEKFDSSQIKKIISEAFDKEVKGQIHIYLHFILRVRLNDNRIINVRKIVTCDKITYKAISEEYRL